MTLINYSYIQSLFIYILIGVLPCLVWLLFYLRQDSHPESNKKIIQVFLLGALLTIPAIAIENGFEEIFTNIFGFDISNISSGNPFLIFLAISLGVGLIEEFLKYFTVKISAISSSEFDEPMDIILYMIIASLGFAAVENFLAILPASPEFLNSYYIQALEVSAWRLITAIFFHTLSSGIIGVFWAFSIFYQKKRWLILGILTMSFYHGLYNFILLSLNNKNSLLTFIFIFIILVLALFLFYNSKKVKKMPRACKIKD